MSFIYDAGVLIAAERNERAIWAAHRARLELGLVPFTTAPVVAQVSRSSRQVQLRRFLRGCAVVPFALNQAHEVGALLAASGGSDVVDAHLIAVAVSTANPTVLTSDPDDLTGLADALDVRIRIVAV